MVSPAVVGPLEAHGPNDRSNRVVLVSSGRFRGHEVHVSIESTRTRQRTFVRARPIAFSTR